MPGAPGRPGRLGRPASPGIPTIIIINVSFLMDYLFTVNAYKPITDFIFQTRQTTTFYTMKYCK